MFQISFLMTYWFLAARVRSVCLILMPYAGSSLIWEITLAFNMHGGALFWFFLYLAFVTT